MENMYECPICHKKYEAITDMANCIIADEKKKQSEISKQKIVAMRKEITQNFTDLQKKIVKYNNSQSDEKLAVSFDTAKTLVLKDTLAPKDEKHCGEDCYCKSKNVDDELTTYIKELSKKIASGKDIFTLFD